MENKSNFYKDIIDHLYDGVYFVDRERVITYWNHGAERITGYESQNVIGRSCRDNILNHVDSAGTQLCQDQCPMAACMKDGEVREAHVLSTSCRRPPRTNSNSCSSDYGREW